LRNGLAVSIQYINVRVRQTARQTPRCSIGRVAEITAPPLSCFNSPHETKNAVFRKKQLLLFSCITLTKATNLNENFRHNS